MTSRGNVCASSHSITCGAISASANSRTALRNWSCSGEYSNSTLLLYDLFPGGVPTDRALLPVALELLGKDRAHVAELAQLADDVEGKRLRLVPLHYMRRNFRLGELPNSLAQLELFGGIFELHLTVIRSLPWRRPNGPCVAAGSSRAPRERSSPCSRAGPACG